MANTNNHVGEVTPMVRLLIHSFHTISITLLTTLLPLSFLLLSRLSSSPSLLTFLISPPTTPFYIFIYILLLLLHLIIPLICFLTLLHVFTSYSYHVKPRLCLAWVVLIIVQISVGLGVEATIKFGVSPVYYPSITSLVDWIRRAVFVVGSYEIMMFWSRNFVRQVVDNTIFEAPTEEETGERVVVGLVVGLLWLGILREEVEGLGVVRMDVGWNCVVCRLISLLVVVNGMTRILRGIYWMGKHMVVPLHRKEPEVPVSYVSHGTAKV